jgi:hypothetical protein
VLAWETSFPSEDDSHGVRAWALNIEERVLNTRTDPRQDSPRNSRDPNVPVAIAGEDKDGIDDHRHGPLMEGNVFLHSALLQAIEDRSILNPKAVISSSSRLAKVSENEGV